ncbi:MAG: hypothetical protein ACRD63_10950 [Pyrinomonadaceae bacterium]
MINKEKLSRTIAFRVTDEQFQEIESRAMEFKDTPTDLCRSLVLENLQKNSLREKRERLILEEIGRIHFLIGSGLGLLATGELTRESWEREKKTADMRGSEIADGLLKRYLHGGTN